MDKILIRLIDLPGSVRAFTMPDQDGDFNVYVSTRLNFHEQKKAASHEIGHILRGDFDMDNVNVIETVAHAMDMKG